MTITDYVRMYLGTLTAFVFTLTTVYFLAALLERHLEDDERAVVRTVRNWATLAAAAAFGLYMFASSVTNTLPRGTVNRKVVEEQHQYEYLDRH